jgi:2-methylcitrate dehydratase PrpD
MTIAEQLGAWATGLRIEDVPPPARHAACRHLLDGLGTAICAARTGAGQPAVRVAAGLGGPDEATSLGDGARLGAPAAALANGALVHALDFDDTHAEGLVHATAIALPTMLAVGQQVGATGAEALAAAVVGYEVLCRLASGSPHGFHARGLHATSVCGPLAAAAVAARLGGLDAPAATAALGIAGSSSAGLLEFLATGAATKQLHTGLAAMAGIVAARLAAAGAEGPPAVVEGERGLYAALSARPADAHRVTRGLGEEWEVTRLTAKPYPACQLMHAALDAGARLRDQVAAGELDRLEVEVHPDSAAIVCDPPDAKVHPRTVYDAKFSLQWSLAALLIDGTVGVDTYTSIALDRPDVAALSEKVVPRAVPGAMPAADAPARIRATTRAGREVVIDVPCSAGGPARPLSDEELRAKFLRNAGDDGATVRALSDDMLDLETAPSLDALAAAAVRAARAPAEASA